MKSKKIIIKKSIALMLVFTLISSLGLCDLAMKVRADGEGEIISVEETGANIVRLKVETDNVGNLSIVIDGQGQIDRGKYIQVLRNAMPANFATLGNGTLLFKPYGKTINLRVVGNGIIYAPEDSSYFFNRLSKVILSDYFDTSKVTNMEGMFQSISDQSTLMNDKFDTREVKNFKNMFYSCTNFNQALPTNFITTKGEEFDGMFASCQAFNQSLAGHFDTHNAKSMKKMFNGTTSFDSSLGDEFDTSNVTSMHSMFEGSSFNQPLGNKFDTENVTSMGHMFSKSPFNQPLGDKFDTSNVTSMAYMFSESDFNQPLGDKFDTENVISMENMFNKSDFDQPLGDKFDTSNVTSMAYMFSESPFNQPLGDKFDTSNVTSMAYMFFKSDFNQPLGDKFDTSNVESMEGMFQNNRYFSQRDVENFKMDKCKNISKMFYNHYNKNSLSNLDLSGWNTENVNNMTNFIYNNSIQSLNLGEWEVDSINQPVYNFLNNVDIDYLRISIVDKNKSSNKELPFYSKGHPMILYTINKNGINTSNVNNYYRLKANEGMTIFQQRQYRDGTPPQTKNKISSLLHPSHPFDRDELKLENVEKGTRLGDLEDELNNKLPSNCPYRLEFLFPDKVLSQCGTVKAEVEGVLKNHDNAYYYGIDYIEITVKEKIEITDIKDITTDDITKVKDEDIQAKAMFADQEVEGSFVFEPALDTLSLNEGDNEVDIKFTANQQPELAFSDTASAKLKIIYNKPSNNDGANSGSGNASGTGANSNSGNGNGTGTGSNSDTGSASGTGNNSNSGNNSSSGNSSSSSSSSSSSTALDSSESASNKETSKEGKKEKFEDKKIDHKKLANLPKEKLKEKLTDLVNKHLEKKAKEEIKSLVEKYIEYKKEKAKRSNKGGGETDKREAKNLKTSSGRELTDVKKDDYYADSIKFVVENRIIQGISEDEFSPKNLTTNAMADTIIYRLSGVEKSLGDELQLISDDDEWFSAAIEWAKISGIIFGDENYDPSGIMRRDDFVLHLYRYSKKLGYADETFDDSVFEKFKDKESLEEAKRESMRWAVGNGIIVGTTEIKLEPSMNITRGQLAIVIEKYLDYLSKKV